MHIRQHWIAVLILFTLQVGCTSAPDAISVYRVANLPTSADVRTHLAADPAIATQSDEDGKTLLHHVCLILSITGPTPQDICARVRAALEAGADPNAVDHDGRTPFHYAAASGLHDVFHLLVPVSGIDARDNDGITPLMFACRTNRTASIRTLLELGASVNALDNNGRTPLMHYCLFPVRTTDGLRALIMAGASLDVEDFENRTCFAIAKEARQPSIVFFILGTRL